MQSMGKGSTYAFFIYLSFIRFKIIQDSTNVKNIHGLEICELSQYCPLISLSNYELGYTQLEKRHRDTPALKSKGFFIRLHFFPQTQRPPPLPFCQGVSWVRGRSMRR